MTFHLNRPDSDPALSAALLESLKAYMAAAIVGLDGDEFKSTWDDLCDAFEKATGADQERDRLTQEMLDKPNTDNLPALMALHRQVLMTLGDLTISALNTVHLSLLKDQPLETQAMVAVSGADRKNDCLIEADLKLAILSQQIKAQAQNR